MYLAKFVLSVRKVNQSECEPDTIKGYQSSIQRYLNSRDFPEGLLVRASFKQSQDVLWPKHNALKQMGPGNKKKRADSFTEDEIILQKKLHRSGKAK